MKWNVINWLLSCLFIQNSKCPYSLMHHNLPYGGVAWDFAAWNFQLRLEMKAGACVWCKIGRDKPSAPQNMASQLHRSAKDDRVLAQETRLKFLLPLPFRFWTFNIRERLCYLKDGRPTLREAARGSFISGSTRDDGCGKKVERVHLLPRNRKKPSLLYAPQSNISSLFLSHINA